MPFQDVRRAAIVNVASQQAALVLHCRVPINTKSVAMLNTADHLYALTASMSSHDEYAVIVTINRPEPCDRESWQLSTFFG